MYSKVSKNQYSSTRIIRSDVPGALSEHVVGVDAGVVAGVEA